MQQRMIAARLADRSDGEAHSMATGADETGADAARRLSLSDSVSGRLREELLDATWRPGELLLEADLAVRYGVSKTPVREALRALSQEGWIETVPRRGYLVRRLRVHDVREIFDLRLLLEPALIARTARQANPTEMKELRRIAEQPAAGDGKLDGRSAPGREFHLVAARIARNHRAYSTVAGLMNEVRRLHRLLLDVEARSSEPNIEADHLAMVAAVEASDGELAYRLMHDHISTDAARMLDAFKQSTLPRLS